VLANEGGHLAYCVAFGKCREVRRVWGGFVGVGSSGARC
jgi:hypothetical protein